jgi:tetratricopeptide (TPR) repeat protein
MKSLKRLDNIHLEAAQGWLELDNSVEAGAELEKIAPAYRRHPEVLQVRWKVCAHAQKWETCLEIAEILADLIPRQSVAWLFLAASLNSLGQTEEAYETLIEVVEDFPDDPAIPYQLACYGCTLNLLDDAQGWLEEAFQKDGGKELKMMALKDPSLERMWAYLQTKK